MLAWTLLANEHIRIDIVNQMLPKRVRDWIDVVGHAFFLLPLTIVMIVTGVPFFLVSYRIRTSNRGNAGGLPQWPSKALIMVGFRPAVHPGHLRIDQAHRDHARADGRPARGAEELA